LEGVTALPSSPVDPAHRLAEQTIAQGFPLLIFPKALEDRFLGDVQASRFVMITVAGIASVILFASLLMVDVLMTPDIVRMAAVLRLGAYAPIVLAALYLLRQLHRPLLTEWMVAGGGVLACLVSVWIYLNSTAPLVLTRVVELNIVVVYICAFARFWPALSLTAVVLVAHTFVLRSLHDFTGILGANTTLLIATTIGFALFGNYKLEHDERLAFLLDMREKALDTELQAAHDRLARTATTDALTELANRRYFEDFLSDCAQHARDEGRSLSLILIDIDYFKPYNDHYGHQAGDQCLIAVARALTACMRRPLDLVARWGGEEFAVVMSDADLGATLGAAERIRHAVQALGLPHVASACAPVVSVSVGLACASAEQALALPDLINRADVALYQAKARGRNQVCQDPAS
jgi:diguanylate cyclase (GGDEF)-like protein